MKSHPFTRPTVVAAIEFLGVTLKQARFDQLVVRLALNRQIALGPAISLAAKSAQLAHLVTQSGTQPVSTLNGLMTLAEAAVREAVDVLAQQSANVEQERFLRGLSLDGYVIAWHENASTPQLRTALPSAMDLPAADDEVHQLLRHFGFHTTLGHLDQAIDAHTRGDWAAANSQIRTFLESLIGDIALNIAMRFTPQAAAALTSAENCRAWLMQQQFLSSLRNEWTPDGKNYLNGLFKMLHTDGSHPGLSDDDHSTFRLHLGLVTGRALLRRLYNKK